MAVWLKCADLEMAFEHDVVPREAMRWLDRLDELETLADERSQALHAQAESQAEAIRAAAQSAAEQTAAKAAADAAAVKRLGHAQGRRDALQQWHAEALRQRRAAAESFGGQRERLADMVVQATASLLQDGGLDRYLGQALQALDDLAQRDISLSVTVHPADEATAREAIEALRPQWREQTVVKLVTSAELERGSCICESPQGYVDGSLSNQLATLRQAALGALDDLAPAPGLTPDLPVAPEVQAETLADAVARPPESGLFPSMPAAFAMGMGPGIGGPGGLDAFDDLDDLGSLEDFDDLDDEGLYDDESDDFDDEQDSETSAAHRGLRPSGPSGKMPW